MQRRHFLAGATCAGAAFAGVWAKPARAADLSLTVQPARFSMNGQVTNRMLSYSGNAPPPVIRMKQGQRFVTDLVNGMDEETTIHWHGMRVPAAMDGVPYLAQDPVPPGGTFRYDFTPQDAGTFWYHPHCNTLDQMARGLTGIVVVEEAVDPGFDVDLPLNLRDFRLGSDGQFIEFFKPRNSARAGTFGTMMTANWQVSPVHDLPAGGLVRLRLVATDTTRIYKLYVQGATGRIIALDGQPVPGPVPWPTDQEPLLLAPGQRADIALRMPDTAGQECSLIADVPGGTEVLARFRATGQTLGRDLAELAPLPPNPIAQPDLANAERLDFLFGWSPGGDAPASGICGTLGYTFWSINRVAFAGDVPDPFAPLAVMERGNTYVLRLQNETENDHPIHLHGMTFQVLQSDSRPLTQVFSDTTLLRSHEVIEVAVVADNPGEWMFHCHVIEHQKTGLAGYIRVV